MKIKLPLLIICCLTYIIAIAQEKKPEKEEMLKEGIDSPDVADSLSLTFATQDIPPSIRDQQASITPRPNPDPYL